MDAVGMTEGTGTVKRLMEQRLVVRGGRVGKPQRGLSTGLPALDEFLPHGGLLPGGLTEWVGDAVHLLAGWPLAYHQGLGKAIYVGMRGCVHPLWVETLAGGGEEAGALDGYYAAQWPQPQELAWLTEQVIGSGLFSLVVVGGSDPQTGAPWFDEVVWRRWMGASKRHGTVVLVLVRAHEALRNMARPCWSRLQVSLVKQRVGFHLRLEKCAGSAPGAELELDQSLLVPASSGRGAP